MSDGGIPATPAKHPRDTPGDPGTSAPAPPAFQERLVPSVGVWFVLFFVAVMLGFVALRFGTAGALITFAVTFALVSIAFTAGAPKIEVGPDLFAVAGARIPLSLLGQAEQLDGEQWRTAIGQDLDARAFLCLRGWIKQGVRVQLTDPQDPTPYWVVSSNRPAELVAALRSARSQD